ncbi:hypothetical protein QJQ45_022928, partial [Haematococcus lacustris]
PASHFTRCGVRIFALLALDSLAPTLPAMSVPKRRLDMNCLQASSLAKYMAQYGLVRDASESRSKDEMVMLVSRHFHAQQVRSERACLCIAPHCRVATLTHVECNCVDRLGSAIRAPALQFMLDEEELLIKFSKALKADTSRKKTAMPSGGHPGRAGVGR